MSFFLVRLQPDDAGQMVDVPIPDYGPYDKGSEAAKVAKTLSDQLGYKVQPRRMSQAGDWRERQATRLTDGTLIKLPAAWDLPPIKDHFAHLDPVKRPGMICFTENDELGVIDRVTVLTPGRYIGRFYETEEKMDDARRRKLIALVDPSGELLYARTPEEITKVYMEGPSSCMDGSHACEFEKLPCWPTAVYGAGDLVLAYTVNNKGRIQSRCLIWPEKKLYGRIYGDVQRMQKQLEDEGYTTERERHDADGNGAHLVGARLMKVLYSDGRYTVLPYFDDIGLVVDGGDVWISVEETPAGSSETHPDFAYSGSTVGYSHINSWCPKLLGYYEKYTFQFVKGANERWSRRAVDSYAFNCRETGEVWTMEHRVRLHDGDSVCQEWFDANGAVCEGSGLNVRKKDLVEYEGKRVSRSYKAQQERRKANEDYDWYGRAVDKRAMREEFDSFARMMMQVRPRDLELRAREFEQAWIDERIPVQQPVNVNVSVTTHNHNIPLRDMVVMQPEMLLNPIDPEPHYENVRSVDGSVRRLRVA
ncbi:hypothetical protein [Bradyrhizobium erythrophlei]|uniref:Uncharacterized protein n=1 Tax=Bradyrhizobium erythrophlei TaxID=1437360 RepID=A0A1M5PRD8_9BRAD|nr:hypothetical protein [Bradyrhizobium erythrophlei]SHH04338.1 hypothetical protein SAMN05443248_3479 [Bradyrhizobium erythrophlei]